MTQGEKILVYLDRYGSITPAQAWYDLGISKLSTRIGELIRDGEKIEKRMIPVRNRDEKSVYVMQYRRTE